MPENLKDEIQTRLDQQNEWLLIGASGKSFPLQSSEIELQFSNNKLLFGFLDDKGFQTWRVVNCEFKAGEIVLKLSRNFGSETEKVRLVPRVSAKELTEATELARLEKANRIAALIKEDYPNIKLVRVELNKENGRFAQIILESQNGKQTAALTDVSDALTT